jgi:hypothetical protein
MRKIGVMKVEIGKMEKEIHCRDGESEGDSWRKMEI